MESQEFLNYAENVDPVDLEENVVGARGGGVARTRSPISRGHKHAQIPACQKLHNQTQKRIQRSKLTLLNNLFFCWQGLEKVLCVCVRVWLFVCVLFVFMCGIISSLCMYVFM